VQPSTCTTRARCTNEQPPRCASHHEHRTGVRLDAVSDRAVDERRQDAREGGGPPPTQAAPRLAHHRRRPAVSCRRHRAAMCAIPVAGSRIDVTRIDVQCASTQSPRRGSEAADATTRVTGAPRVAPMTNAAMARVTRNAHAAARRSPPAARGKRRLSRSRMLPRTDVPCAATSRMRRRRVWTRGQLYITTLIVRSAETHRDLCCVTRIRGRTTRRCCLGDCRGRAAAE